MDFVGTAKTSVVIGPGVYNDGSVLTAAVDCTDYGEIAVVLAVDAAAEAGILNVKVAHCGTSGGSYASLDTTDYNFTEVSAGVFIGRILTIGLGPFFKLSMTVTSAVVEDQMAVPFCGMLLLGQPRYTPSTAPLFSASK